MNTSATKFKTDDFILNTRTKVLHKDSCYYSRWIQKENRRIIDERPYDAIPCKYCKPGKGTPLLEVLL